jgi:hypothetical protein
MMQPSSENPGEPTSIDGLFAWFGLKGLVEHQEHSKLLPFLEGLLHVLEMIARSASLPAVLEELTRVTTAIWRSLPD